MRFDKREKALEKLRVLCDGIKTAGEAVRKVKVKKRKNKMSARYSGLHRCASGRDSMLSFIVAIKIN